MMIPNPMNGPGASLFASLLVSSIGIGFLIYGRKQRRLPQMILGLALSGAPFLVPGVAWMLSVSALLLAGFWVALRAGV